ncbi:MAG: pyrimidine/purine nucleoside phosphorylase [bacterium]
MFESNEYFDGKVKSIAFQTESLPATVGVMAPGDYVFNTAAREKMVVVSGAMDVTLPGNQASQTFASGESFDVPADSSFGVSVEQDTAYLCLYG